MTIGLNELVNGRTGMVSGLTGPAVFLNRANAFGFTPGTKVRMIRNPHKGPVIAYLRDTFIVLGRSEAACVRLTAAR